MGLAKGRAFPSESAACCRPFRHRGMYLVSLHKKLAFDCTSVGSKLFFVESSMLL